MRRLTVILTLVLLAGCTSYPIKDGGDGVYYASSPPEYTYVDGYFGFPYYGPYSWAWYHPTWYSPIVGHHYSWYRPYYYWGYPYGWPPRYAVRHNNHRQKHPPQDPPANSTPKTRPMPPVELGDVAVLPNSPKSGYKRVAYTSPSAKSRSTAKSSSKTYRAPRMSSSASTHSASSSSNLGSSRQSTSRSSSRDIQ